ARPRRVSHSGRHGRAHRSRQQASAGRGAGEIEARAMSEVAAAALRDPYALGHGEGAARGHGAGGPASKRIVVGYGFWIFLLSDIVMFSALFATYAVLVERTAGGPSGKDLFDLT